MGPKRKSHSRKLRTKRRTSTEQINQTSEEAHNNNLALSVNLCENQPYNSNAMMKTKFEILDDIFQLIKKSSAQNELSNLVTLLLTLLNSKANEEQLRSSILSTFIQKLDTYTDDQIKALTHKTKDVFLPKDLRKKTLHKIGILEVKENNYIGAGAYAVITIGKLTNYEGEKTIVAIKQPRLRLMEKSLLLEAKILSELEHPNIVKLISFQRIPLKLIIEFMPKKDLVHVLRDQKFENGKLFKMIHDIVSGMEYVAEHKIVHCDLTCRNIFVDNNFKCKIGDFGVAKYLDINGKCKEMGGGNILKAPEVHKTGIYTIKSDVWMIGSLICDIFKRNYPKDASCHMAIVEIEKVGIPLTPIKPMGAAYNYLTNIMSLRPSRRPTFSEIKYYIERQQLNQNHI